MAQLVFSRGGAALGKTLLPNGISVFGANISGAAIGQAVGAYAGSVLAAPTRDGPRIPALSLMESREGAGIANVYGRARVGAQLIWAARFKERSKDRSTAGKGSPKVREYRYSVSFAVALCEGEATRIGQVWANGEPFDLAGIAWRFYPGREDQSPDPLIEAIEGAGNAPAYRGLCYVVFEDLPLDAFGNRLPQLSFEVFRAAPEDGDIAAVRELVHGVNIIPASGEFAYDTDIIRTRRFPGIETPQNVHSMRGEADFAVSMDQLQADLPQVRRAALTVGWFGDDLRAGHCQIRPGVELPTKSTVPEAWRAGGVDRAGAYQISQSAGGPANYGGTPSDASIIRALRDLAARGIQPVLTPFLFMDVPPGNGLPDPYGGGEQAAFPWRGRITGSAADVAAFLGDAQPGDFAVEGERVIYSGDANDWGYRRFILHLAHLAKIAGSVEAFLVGSEMAALTRVRAVDGSFPFADGLAVLASDVKQLLGPGVNISYAADWTEYGAYVDGADISFPLDGVWASDAVDFIGVDWYPPMADWRDGETHLDALAGYSGLEDPAYLSANIDGGEAYDWYYASAADRDAQIRTPIIDTAHGEDWLFRQKDILGWWSSAHHERPGGVRDASPTPWLPGSKPIRLMEIGFPAIDKGANAPNLFYDPKSAESALPSYSDGTRNDLQQRRALEAALSYWHAEGAVEAVYVWCWDARPYPAFPALSDVWSDGANWQYGHWLNGRVTASQIGAIVQDICARGGAAVNTSALRGVVEGYALSGVSSVRGALESLRAAYGFNVAERGGEIVFEMPGAHGLSLRAEETVGDGPAFTRRLLDKRPGALRLTYISARRAYAPTTVEARDASVDRGDVVDAALAIVMGDAQAEALAAALLARAVTGDGAQAGVSLAHIGFEPGDVVTLEGRETDWQITEIEDTGITRLLSMSEHVPPPVSLLTAEPGGGAGVAILPGAPELLVIDAIGNAPLVAAAATPWPGDVRVLAGSDAAALTERAQLTDPAIMGLALSGAALGPLGRWDRASGLTVQVPGRALSSASASAVLSGANQLLVETTAGWELLSFQTAQLVSPDTYELSGFLRGLQNTSPGEIAVDARCVILDETVMPAVTLPEDRSVETLWRADGEGAVGDFISLTYEARGMLAYRPGHLRAVWQGSDLHLSWTRRGADVPLSWALPEVENSGDFRVEFRDASSVLSQFEVGEPRAVLAPPANASEVHVSEIGVDGRPGAAIVLPIPAAVT